MPLATNGDSNGTNGSSGHALDMTVLGLNSGTSMVSFQILEPSTTTPYHV
jgi:hypothetical protein